MREKRIDINVLNVFYAVMIERSVTRAAERLSMTQPAVSNALNRLRHQFKDELFIKAAGGVRPTERATAIWQGIRRPMEELRSVAIASDFEPARTHRVFNIAITDTLSSRVVPLLTARFISEAPLAKLNFHFHSNPASVTGLERGGLDCAVGMFPNFSPSLIVEGIADDDYVCVFRRDHPILTNGVSLGQFLEAKHILVKQSLRQLGMVDAWMSLQGMERNIVVTVNAAAEALNAAMNSDLVAAVPRSYVLSADTASRLAWAPLPFPHDRIVYKMAWHERTEREPSAIWLRSIVKDAVARALEHALSATNSRGLPSHAGKTRKRTRR